jgi:hypothetical protein
MLDHIEHVNKTRMKALVDALSVRKSHIRKYEGKDQWYIKGTGHMSNLTTIGDDYYKGFLMCRSNRQAAAIKRKLESYGIHVQHENKELVALFSDLPNEQGATYIRSLLGFRSTRVLKPFKDVISKKPSIFTKLINTCLRPGFKAL